MNATDQRLALLQAEIDTLRQQLTPTLVETDRRRIYNGLFQCYRGSIGLLSQHIEVFEFHSARNKILKSRTQLRQPALRTCET